MSVHFTAREFRHLHLDPRDSSLRGKETVTFQGKVISAIPALQSFSVQYKDGRRHKVSSVSAGVSFEEIEFSDDENMSSVTITGMIRIDDQVNDPDMDWGDYFLWAVLVVEIED